MSTVISVPSILSIVYSSIIFLLSFTTSVAQERSFEHSSMVIVKVPELTSAQYHQISSGLARDHQYSVEYVCLESGIIVLKFYHSFIEVGDVHMAVNTALARTGKLKDIEFVYVDIQKGASSQC